MKPDPKAHGNAEIVDLLRRMLDLLGGPDYTHPGGNLAKVEEAHSFTASGISCEAWDQTAARWTLVGALAKFCMAPAGLSDLPDPALREAVSAWKLAARNAVLFDDSFRYLFSAAILQAPQTVNGVNNRGWDATRDLLEFAILLAEHEAVVMPMLVLPDGRVPSPELRKRLEQIMQVKGASVQVPS